MGSQHNRSYSAKKWELQWEKGSACTQKTAWNIAPKLASTAMQEGKSMIKRRNAERKGWSGKYHGSQKEKYKVAINENHQMLWKPWALVEPYKDSYPHLDQPDTSWSPGINEPVWAGRGWGCLARPSPPQLPATAKMPFWEPSYPTVMLKYTLVMYRI